MPQARIDATVADSENNMVKYMMLATQVARDAAPYIHPRLAALAVTTDRNTTTDLFDLLLQQIAEGPRMQVIEHRADEVREDEEAA